MKLVIRIGDKVAEEVPFDGSGTWMLGRHPDNNIVINDAKASRHHGMFAADGGKYFFEDLGSGNGSFLKGERLDANTRVEVGVGDRIDIGATSIAIEEGEAEVEDKDGKVSDSEGTKVADGKTGMLAGTAGPLKGESFGLGDGEIQLGRLPTCHIKVDDPLASRHNTDIKLVEGVYVVDDLKSSNGTFVNGDRIQSAKLNDGDSVRIGGHEFHFSIVDASAAPPVARPEIEAMPTVESPAGETAMAGVAKKSGGMGSKVATLAVLAALGGGGYFYFTGQGDDEEEGGSEGTPATVATEPQPAVERSFPVVVGKATIQDVEVALEKTGNVTPSRQDVIPFQVGLKVEEVHVSNQDRVQDGDKLITFEAPEALRTGRVQALAGVNQAIEDVGKAEGEVAKAVAAVANAKDLLRIAQEAYDRNEPLYRGGNLLQAEWDQIQTNLTDAKANIAVREQEKEQAERTVTQAQETVTQVKADLADVESKIEDLAVTATSGGIVDKLELKKGYTVTPDTGFMVLLEYEDEVKVITSVSEADIVLVKEGMPAEVWLPRAPDDKFEGTVTLIPPTATNRNYEVEVTVANESRHFRPGQQAVVRFITDINEGAITLPATAIGAGRRGGFYVYQVDVAEGQANQVMIRRGEEVDRDGITFVEILPAAGTQLDLSPDDVIVFDGFETLQDGAKVEVTNPEAVQ